MPRPLGIAEAHLMQIMGNCKFTWPGSDAYGISKLGLKPSWGCPIENLRRRRTLDSGILADKFLYVLTRR